MNNEGLIIFGIISVLIGIGAIILAGLKEGNVKFAVGGFIGPIPFGWFNDPKMVPLLIGLMILGLIIFLMLK